MSNYSGMARTNYFRVKNRGAFRKWAKRCGFQIWVGNCNDKAGMFALGPSQYSDSGTIDMPFDKNDEPRDFINELSRYLADDQICVLMEAGSEKLRYICGNAVAFNNKGSIVQVNLNDIYRKAKDFFGVSPTACEY